MSQKGETIRVLVVDDHPMVRRGLKTYLETADDIQMVGEAGDLEEALSVVRSTPPEVILLDLVLPGPSGPQAVRALRQAAPKAQIVILTSYGDPDRAVEVLRSGAVGFLLKSVAPEDLLEAIRQAARGRSVLDRAVAEATFGPLPQRARAPRGSALTPREGEVLRLMGRGLTNPEIAQGLGVAEKTVKAHIGRIYGKLGVPDRTQAVITAVRQGLIRIEPEGHPRGP